MKRAWACEGLSKPLTKLSTLLNRSAGGEGTRRPAEQCNTQGTPNGIHQGRPSLPPENALLPSPLFVKSDSRFILSMTFGLKLSPTHPLSSLPPAERGTWLGGDGGICLYLMGDFRSLLQDIWPTSSVPRPVFRAHFHPRQL